MAVKVQEDIKEDEQAPLYVLFVVHLQLAQPERRSKINQLWLFRAYNYVIVLQLPLIILSMHVTGPRRHAHTKDGYNYTRSSVGSQAESNERCIYACI